VVDGGWSELERRWDVERRSVDVELLDGVGRVERRRLGVDGTTAAGGSGVDRVIDPASPIRHDRGFLSVSAVGSNR
jgi:hypothetical protein